MKEKSDVLIAKQIEEMSFHTLRDHLVDIYRTEGKTARDVVGKFLDKKLRRLPEHSRESAA